MGQIIGIIAFIVMLIAGGFFVFQIKKETSTPNLITWLTGLLVGTINAPTFYKIAGDDLNSSLIMFASLSTLVVIFIYSLLKNKFAKPTLWDIAILVVAIVILVLWQLATDNRTANFLVQIVIFVSNIATIVGLLRKKLKEYPTSWIWGVSAYTIAVIGFLFKGKTDWLMYFGPILNGIICNGVVYIIAWKQNKNKLTNNKEQ
jgi:xanthine/uracil permease